MNCPDCGARNPADAKFCGDCGHSIAIAPPPEPPPPVDPYRFGWDAVFKWIGIGVVGLFVLGLLAGF